MPYTSKRIHARMLILALTAGIALAMSAAARAEFPTKRADPSIVGIPQEGQTLNGRNGQWLMDNGLNCTDCKFTYTWQRCNGDGSGCVDVAGRTGYTYLLGPEDVGRRVRFVEWISKRDCGAGSTETGIVPCADITKNGVSQPYGPITAKPVVAPQVSGTPTVQGTPMEDEVLRATGATWTGPGTITKTIYWQRCNTAGEGCATIPGATGETYRLTATDVGARIRVIETATNQGGAAQSVSAVTAVVVELRPTAFRKTVTAEKVSLPHRLVLNQVTTQQSGKVVTIRVRVGDDRGFRISGIQVEVTPTGLLAGSAAARMSNADGWATFTYRATGSGTTYVFVEAHRKGENAQEGISSANMFKVRVR